MNTFDRHLLREWLQIFAMTMIATCGLLCVHICHDDLRSLREAGARGMDLLRYVAVTMPSFATLVLPVGLLFSLLFVLTKMHRANEITAMRVAGVGFFRLTLPLWLVGVACCGLSWWLNSTVMPWSVEQSRALIDNHEFRLEAQSLPPDRIGAVADVAFNNPTGHRMWFFNRYSKASGRGYGVFVSELDDSRHETSRIVASEAWFDPARHGWEFKNGRELDFDPENGVDITSVPFADKFEAGFDEDPRLILLIDRKPADLSFFELRRLLGYFAQTGNPKGVPYAVRYYGLIAATLVPLIVIAIAIPFSVSGVRTNPAVGVSKSIGLFVLYYLLDTVATALATKHLIEPAAAAWLPNAAMAALALWLFARLR